MPESYSSCHTFTVWADGASILWEMYEPQWTLLHKWPEDLPDEQASFLDTIGDMKLPSLDALLKTVVKAIAGEDALKDLNTTLASLPLAAEDKTEIVSVTTEDEEEDSQGGDTDIDDDLFGLGNLIAGSGVVDRQQLSMSP